MVNPEESIQHITYKLETGIKARKKIELTKKEIKYKIQNKRNLKEVKTIYKKKNNDIFRKMKYYIYLKQE